jgi:UDP-N-acetylmuramyl pentapeptide phosphotransferase/UDP-N-acetylglucosamine-1-phosphate transferase
MADLDPSIRTLLAFVLAAIPSVILCRVVMAFGFKDAPTEARKTQEAPVPTTGGLAVAVAALGAAALIARLAGWAEIVEPLLQVTCAGALAALALGFADDTSKVSARVKFILMLAIALVMTIFGVRADTLSPWPGISLDLPMALGVAGSVLWLIVVVNAVNFMDGANGLSMGMAAIAAAGLAACAGFAGAWSIALLAATLAGALAGFLVWNVAGKLFVGDTGALFVGTALGGLGLELVHRRPDLLFVPPLLLLPFLSDVLLTLAWRARHGKKLWVAHRDHAYQIAIKAKMKHWQVAAIHAVWAFNAAGFALMATVSDARGPLLAFLLLLGISTWLHLRVRRVGVKAGLVGANIP